MRTLGTMAVLGGAALVVYGCSAAANAPVGDGGDGGGNASQDYGSGDNSTSDASTGGKRDGGGGGGGSVYDAGPPKLPEGSPCDPLTADSDPQNSEGCGLCGTQTRACLPGPDGGAATWGAWGFCQNEATGTDACDPSKTYAATACGNCGTMPQVCDSTTCHFETGFDCTEPAGACTPGDIKFVLGASCTTPGQGRQYTCASATCQYGSPSACEPPPPNPNSLTISSTAGTTVNTTFTLSASKTTDRPESGSCPTSIDTGSNSAYMDIGIVNPTTRTVTVSVWDGRAGSGQLDTVMAWYASPVWPVADRTACQGTVSDDCSTDSADCANTTASGDTRWSSLSGTGALSIPPSSTVTVTVAMYSGSDTPGSFKLYAKTEN